MANSIFGLIMDIAERTPLLGRMVLKGEQRLWDRHIKRLRVDAGHLAYQATDGVVAKGLFKGMRVDRATSWGFDQYTVLSGQYETELQPVLRQAIGFGYPCFIDIGCANGLYAVGLALVTGATDIVAYDIDPEARAATRANAALNDVAGRVHVGEEASHAELSRVVRHYGGAFVICDIEGAELEVLDPARCPELRDTDLLVEVHGDVERAIAVLRERFEGSHAARVIARTPRSPFEDPYLNARSEDEAWALVSEGRTFSKNNWLLLHRPQFSFTLAET